MGTTVDKLNKLLQTKAAIKTAIEAKGVTVGDAKFADYPTKIAAIEGGGGSTSASHERILDRMKVLLNEALAKYTNYVRGNIFAFRPYPWIQNLYRWSNDVSNKAWEIGGTLYSYTGGDTVFIKHVSEFSNLGFTDSEGYNLKYVIVLFSNNTQDNSYHCFYEFPMVDIDGTRAGNNGNLNMFRYVVSNGMSPALSYVDTPELLALDLTDCTGMITTSTGYEWKGNTAEYIRGINFANFTGKFDFSNIHVAKGMKNLTAFQIQNYGYQMTTDTLIEILNALIDTTASPKSQGVGNTANLRKLQASNRGLAAIARAKAKGYTITTSS